MAPDFVDGAGDAAGPVFRPVTNNRTRELDRALDPGSVYHNVVLKFGRETGVSSEVNGLCVHSPRHGRHQRAGA